MQENKEILVLNQELLQMLFCFAYDIHNEWKLEPREIELLDKALDLATPETREMLLKEMNWKEQ